MGKRYSALLRRARWITGVGLIAVATAITGCADPIPSYRLRWTVVEEEDPAVRFGDLVPETDSVVMCSSHGIATVRAEVFRDEDVDRIVDDLNIEPETEASEFSTISKRTLLEDVPCAQWVDFARTRVRYRLERSQTLRADALESALAECRSFWRAELATSDLNEEDTKAAIDARCEPEGMPDDSVLGRRDVIYARAIEAGVAAVQLDALNRHEWPCFPKRFDDPTDMVRGDDLGYSGTVVMCVSGRSRSGNTWDTEDNEPAIASVTIPGVELREGETVDLVRPVTAPEREWRDQNGMAIHDPPKQSSLRLLAPPECEDAVDNDKDGLVDEFDPACRLAENPDNSEGFDSEVTLVATDLEVFGGGADFFCGTAEITAFRMFLLDPAGDVVAADQIIGCNGGSLAFKTQVLANAEPGTYQIHVEGIDFVPDPIEDDEPLPAPADTPRAGPVVRSIEVAADQGQLFTELIEFGPNEWMPALDAVPHIGYDQSCTGKHQLVLDTVTLELRDDNGDPVAPAGWVAGSAPLTITGNVGEGACTPTERLVGPSITWGGRSARLRLGVGNEVCFESDGFVQLFPRSVGSPQYISMNRVLGPNDEPPAACRECQQHSDCTETTDRCEAGVCLPYDPTRP